MRNRFPARIPANKYINVSNIAVIVGTWISCRHRSNDPDKAFDLGPRQGAVISTNPFIIRGESGEEYECEGTPGCHWVTRKGCETDKSPRKIIVKDDQQCAFPENLDNWKPYTISCIEQDNKATPIIDLALFFQSN